MKETISVTQADIDQAREEIGRYAEGPAWSAACPIAQALKRRYPGSCPRANADGLRRYAEHEGEPEVILWAVPPSEARWFMSRFDCKEEVEPFEFTVEWSTTDPA